MMARKGFWKRLFGGSSQAGQTPKQEGPGPPAGHGADPPPAAESAGTEAHDQTTRPAQPGDEEAHETQENDDATPTPPDAQRGEAENDQDQAQGHAPRPDLHDGEQDTDDDASSDPQTPDPAPEPRPKSETTLPETAELKTDAVGRVYAQSLIELARDADQVDAIAEEIGGLLPLVEPGGDLYLLVTNPAISTEERLKIVSRVFAGQVSDLMLRFLQVVARKGRLGSLDTILGGYLLLVSEHRGLVDVDAYVATAMDDDTAARVAEQIGQSLGKQVTLRQHIDESLIGGLKIKVGDQLIDASVASQLRSMKQKMIAGRRS